MRTIARYKKAAGAMLGGWMLAVAALQACHKTGNVTDTDDSRISFYNASEYLQNQIQNGYGKSYLLIDTPDTTLRPDGTAQQLPGFVRDLWGYQFPNFFYYTRSVQPWISYMRIAAGTHTVLLTDTGAHHPVAFNRIKTTPDIPLSVYYADSAFQFRSWILPDTAAVPGNAIGIRVLDLSPDAGPVFFTINGQYVNSAGFPDTLKYGRVSSFIPWANPVQDTLVIRFYQTADSSNALTTSLLYSTPGHAYNLLLRGYLTGGTWQDPFTGRSQSVQADLQTVITQNK
jgi:hypothetical protein